MKIHERDKKLVGVGGIRCRCCTHNTTVAEIKRLLARRARRRDRQEIQQEVETKPLKVGWCN